MAVASLGPYSGSVHSLMQLMRHDQTSHTDTLMSMLAGSCSSPHMMGLQQGMSSMGGGVEDVSPRGLGRQKRPYYGVTYDELPSVEEPEDGDDVYPHVEKKRRLSFDQVRSLEQSFEVENKLEPERKLQLAKELGLQPRQVAVWFQNRRARWKIKQLERDYEALTQDYNRLQSDLDAVTRVKTTLKAEVNRLKGITSIEDDAKPVESEQCRSDNPAESPAQSGRSDIDHHFSRTAHTKDVVPAATAQELSAGVQQCTTSSDGCNSSADVVEADSPCASDSSHSSLSNRESAMAQTQQPIDAAGHPWAQFPPESFVGPNPMPDGVKIEDMDQAFLLSRLEDQPVLPNWWDWA